jgi:hypothetical protein
MGTLQYKVLPPLQQQQQQQQQCHGIKVSSKDVRKKLQDGDDCDNDDDDTLSTVSSTSVEEEEEASLSLLSCSSSSSISSSITMSFQARNVHVSFANPLVTSIHYRPTCTEEDKYYLHYSEHDYIDFKLDYLTKGNSPLVRKTPRKVGFVRDVVTSTHSVLGRHQRKQLNLYYNEVELQRFLDDFVLSLQQQHHYHPDIMET